MSGSLTLRVAPELSFRLVDLPDQLRPSVGGFYSHYLRPGREPSVPPLEVRFATGADLVADDAAGAVILEQPPVTVRQDGARLLFGLPGAVGWWNHATGEAGVAVGELDTVSVHHLTRTVLVSLLFHLAQSCGWIGLHAAAVVASRRAVVLSGPSGSGKSTLFREAHRAGLGVLSDDLLWLHEGEHCYRAVAFPRGSEPGMPGPTHDDVELAALVLPEIVERDESTLCLLPQARAAGELACQAALLGTGVWAGERFKEVLRIAGTTPCFRLRSGRDRTGIPGLLTELVEDVWAR